MDIMDHSMAHAGVPSTRELRPWQAWLGTGSAVLVGLLFLVAGVWKMTDPLNAATRMTQALLPASLSLPIAISAGIAETFAGVMLLVPRFRRWGAWLCGGMLVAFLIYFAVNYTELRGAECSCFPWIKRAVGPGFFIGDGIMLAMAAAAGVWTRPPAGLRSAAVLLGAVTVFAFGSYGVTLMRQSGIEAPESIVVDGRDVPLHQGRVFLYFYDPECSHCFRAAQGMAKLNWQSDVKLISVPTAQAQFAGQFLEETGLKAGTSNDLELLRETFRFGDPPYGVALEYGRQKAAFPVFEDDQPAAGLRELGFIE